MKETDSFIAQDQSSPVRAAHGQIPQHIQQKQRRSRYNYYRLFCIIQIVEMSNRKQGSRQSIINRKKLRKWFILYNRRETILPATNPFIHSYLQYLLIERGYYVCYSPSFIS
jgi:hypothetical protein